jgi:hypothetical protein
VKLLLVAAFGVCAAAAQITPRIGDINLYGVHKVSPVRLLGNAGVQSGKPLPGSKGDLELALERNSDIIVARVEGVCCEGSEAVLFIGIEERGAPHPSFLSPPAGSARLPDEIIAAYNSFVDAVAKAAAQGHTGEDLSAGHSVMEDPAAAAIQRRFVTFASEHLDWLRDVLHHGPEPEQRAVAATVIGYAPNKNRIMNDLQNALQDPDESVRANALRSLKALAVFSVRHPEARLRISATWLVELLNSLVLNDRLEAVNTLVILTDAANAPVRALVRERGRPALAEMARWKTLRYALPPYLVLGRAAGIAEDQLRTAWEKGDRETIIRQALR